MFQYSKVAKAGKSSWNQVVTGLVNSDVFIVLISQASLLSQFVLEEIEIAFYASKNDGKPAFLIPALIEKGAKPPVLIQHLGRIDLMSYDSGFAALIRQLGLKKNQVPAALQAPVKLAKEPDFAALFSEYRNTHPKGSPADIWSADWAKVGGKSKPLDAPELTASLFDLYWTEIPGALAYVIESSLDADFIVATTPYSGPDTRWSPPQAVNHLLGPPYYRVKAISGPFRPDSPWSNAVQFPWRPDKKLFKALNLTPAPPELSIDAFGVLTWTEVPGASEYVLEYSEDRFFSKPEVVYTGVERNYQDVRSILGPHHFRVKAKDGVWSKTVPAIKFPFIRK